MRTTLECYLLTVILNLQIPSSSITDMSIHMTSYTRLIDTKSKSYVCSRQLTIPLYRYEYNNFLVDNIRGYTRALEIS